MAEIRLQYRWVPSALEPLPSLTHEGPWCRDAVPTGYKLEQRSFTAVVQMGFSLGQWKRHPETKRRIMIAGSGATLLDEGPPDATQSLWQVRASDFQGMGKSSAMGQEPTHTIRPASCPMPTHRSEFPPGYSSAGCFPAEPASASPDTYMESGAIPLVKLMPSSRKNSHPERSPLDPAHISRRLCCNAQVGRPGPGAELSPSGVIARRNRDDPQGSRVLRKIILPGAVALSTISSGVGL
jgi:hypothetical protein